MLTLLNNFIQEEEGSVVEYIIVLAVIAVVVALLFPGLRKSIQGWFDNMIKGMNDGLTKTAP